MALNTTQLVERFVDISARRNSEAALDDLVPALASSSTTGWLDFATALRPRTDSMIFRKFLSVALNRWPKNADLRVVAADALWHEGQTDVAVSLLREVLAREPAHPAALDTLARICRNDGRLGEASALMADLCRLPDITSETFLDGVQFIQQCQRHRLAADLCDARIASGHADAALFALAGNIHRELGEFDAARADYHQSLHRGVDLNAWFVPGSLALTQKFLSRADDDFALLEHQSSNASLSSRARASTLFGLAKANDDIAAYAEAATHYREANALARSLQTWTRSTFDASLRNIRTRPVTPRNPVTDPGEFAPIFVVGLPRTGTTLASVRLSRHADVRDRGELPLLPFIAQRLRDENQINSPSALHEAANLYRRHVRQDDAPAAFYIDQNPLNFLHLDLIAALFPDARLIHCVRDRRDTALSIYQQFFAHDDYGFAYDFGDIAAFAAAHDALMHHWRSVLPIQIFELPYETMVGDPDTTLANLRRFVGLRDAESRAAPSAITSASMWQARQPIHTASIGRWRHYGPYFPELESLLDAAA